MPRKSAANKPAKAPRRPKAQTPLVAAGEWARGLTPPPALTVSQWADRHRRLPQSSAARGGPWRTDDVPYLRAIMDAVHETGVRKIAVEGAAQVAKSEGMNNILGYFIEHDPCPMLLVHPTAEIAEEWSKERLADMIRSTPALAAVVADRRQGHDAHQGESTLSLKMFPGGFLALGGANTPNTFARRAVRIVFGDDIDRFPAVVGEEGDPADLLAPRTTTFHDGLVIMVSTPTLKGGRIDTLFQMGDQRRYHLTCPFCGRLDWVTWSDPDHFAVRFEGRDPATARIECPDSDHGGCGAHIDEPTRRQMVKRGRWIATAEALEPGLVSFHLPAMVTTLGSASLSKWVADWLAAREKGKESTRVFINTTLAEGWEDRGAKIDPNALSRRREDYGDGVEIPAAAIAVTAGVDVQADRVVLQVIAWGKAFERWVVDWRTVPGDLKQADTKAALLDALSRKYSHATGHLLPIHVTCIDSGYSTDAVYDFVLAYQARRMYATKGYAQRKGEPIVGKVSEKTRGRDGRPVQVRPINVDDAKSDIVQAIAKAEPGPGAMHFPLRDEIDDEYFAQLCAERKETKYNKAKVATHEVWVQERDRNEALDTAVLCLAAFKIFNPNIRQMLEALAGVAVPPAPVPGVAPAPPASVAAKPPQRRIARSSYLGG